MPGIPRSSDVSVNVGDQLQIRRKDGVTLQTVVAGIEMLGRPMSLEAAKNRQNLGTALLLDQNISKEDVPLGSELWWHSSIDE